MSDNSKKKWNWLAHVAAIIASIAALLTSLNGIIKTNEQDKITGHFYNTLSLEILPKLHERIAILEATCKPKKIETMTNEMPIYPSQPECIDDDDCPDLTTCIKEKCINMPLVDINDDDDDGDNNISDKPKLEKFDEFKLPTYNEFKIQAQRTKPISNEVH